jgi:hypothetical protein
MYRTFNKKTRMIYPERQDRYVETEKYPEPAMCAECGNVFENGRWTGKKTYPLSDVFLAKCPACRRRTDHQPAGDVRIKGEFVDNHYDEILGRIRRIERKERATHPVEQILAISNVTGETDISTTGIHLARRIGDALRHSFKGELSYSYGKGEKSIRVTWER